MRAHRDRIAIVEAPDVIEMSDKPGAAVRGKPNSSMVVGLKLQAEGKSDAFVSAGNTGAQMAASMVRAPAARRPQAPGDRHALSHGAASRSSCSTPAPTSTARAEELVQFARLGADLRRGHARPRESRRRPAQHRRGAGEGQRRRRRRRTSCCSGRASTSSATSKAATCRPAALRRGPIDVVVCDGFVGNVVLKFYEAIAPLMIGTLAQGRRRREAARGRRSSTSTTPSTAARRCSA